MKKYLLMFALFAGVVNLTFAAAITINNSLDTPLTAVYHAVSNGQRINSPSGVSPFSWQGWRQNNQIEIAPHSPKTIARELVLIAHDDVFASDMSNPPYARFDIFDGNNNLLGIVKLIPSLSGYYAPNDAVKTMYYTYKSVVDDYYVNLSNASNTPDATLKICYSQQCDSDPYSGEGQNGPFSNGGGF